MTILDIELVHFGKFHHKKIKFSQGLNVVYGKNETGKSTIHAFIHCMLLGMEPDAAGEQSRFYEQYFPWDNRGGYGGSMRLLIGDHVYRIERSFLKEKRYMKLYDETTGQELIPADVKLKELTEGLNETNFVNTVSIGQLKCATEPELVDELERFLYNTSQTKNVRIDIKKAQERLNRKADELREKYLEDADGEYQECKNRLQTAKDEYARFSEQEYQQKRRYESLKKEIEERKRQGEEELLAYDREREESCRRYEAAKRNYEHAPEADQGEPKLFPFVFFTIMAVLFGAGTAWLYFMEGFEQRITVIAAAGFLAALVICIIGMAVSIFVCSRRKKELEAEEELRRKLKKQYEDSAEQFAVCKEREPDGYEEEVGQMQAEMEELEQKMKESSERIDHWKQECETLSVRRQEIRSSVVDNRCIAEELEAVELASRTLEKVAVRVQETFGSRLCKEAAVILSEITGQKYDTIQMIGKKEIRIGTAERMYPLSCVSRGTVEQVYLAIRIAAANLLWQKSSMPFIFDDVFAYYDDERLESAMNLLKDCGHQVIIFSCNTREDRLLDTGKQQREQ